MDSPAPTAELEALLARDGWVRELVRRLVGEQDADDVVQQVWVAALERPPRGSVAAWCAAVARRCAMRWRRDRVRRAQREGAATRKDDLPSPAELMQRLEAQRLVARLVAELDEPFRAAILLRFAEGMTPAAIARHLSVPTATVRTRIHRGLERVRQRLEVEGGSDWRIGFGALFVVGPSCPEPAAGVPWLLGGIGMVSSKQVVTAACAVVLFGVLGWVVVPAPAVAVEERGAAGRSSPLASAPESAASPARVALPAAEPGAVAAAPSVAVRGRVVDATGSPRGGVAIGVRPYPGAGEPLEPPADALAESGADGRFELTQPAGDLVLCATLPFVTLRGARVPRGSDAAGEVLLVVAEARSLRGQVTDVDGVPLSGVEVSTLTLMLDGFPLSLDGTWMPWPRRVHTDARGYFALDHAPASPSVPVLFHKKGYRAHKRRCLGESGPVLVALTPLSAEHPHLTGIVVDAGGRAVGGVVVTAGYREKTTTSSTGEFELPWDGRSRQLVAAKTGYQPAVAAGLHAASGERPLVLTLRGPPLSIGGTVVGADGVPVEGMLVALVDGTPLGFAGTAEMSTVEGSVDQALRDRGAVAATDARGRFVVPGLADRAYRLCVFDPETALAVETEPIAAGARDVVVRIPADAVVPEVRGRFVSPRGEAVPDVSLGVVLTGRGGGGVFNRGTGPSATSAADGTFVLREVPRRHVSVTVMGSGIVEDMLRIDELDLDRPLVLTVDRRCRVRIVPAGAEPGTTVHFEDAAGEHLRLLQFSENLTMSQGGWALDRGDSPVFVVSERATVLVSTRGGEEVARQAVALAVDRVTAITPVR